MIDRWSWQHEDLKQSWHVIAGLDDVEFEGTVLSLSSNAVGYLRQYPKLSLQRSDCVEHEHAMLAIKWNQLAAAEQISTHRTACSKSLVKQPGRSVLPISYLRNYQFVPPAFSGLHHSYDWPDAPYTPCSQLFKERVSFRIVEPARLLDNRNAQRFRHIYEFTILVLLRLGCSLSCIVGGTFAITCYLVPQFRELGAD
jgi:hypothetical protein